MEVSGVGSFPCEVCGKESVHKAGQQHHIDWNHYILVGERMPAFKCERKLKGIGILDDQVGVHELAKMCGSCERTLGNHMKTKMIADGGEFTLK